MKSVRIRNSSKALKLDYLRHDIQRSFEKYPYEKRIRTLVTHSVNQLSKSAICEFVFQSFRENVQCLITKMFIVNLYQLTVTLIFLILTNEKIAFTTPANRLEIQSAYDLRTGEFLEEYGNDSYTRKFAVNQVEETPYVEFDVVAKQNFKHIREPSKNSSDRRKVSDSC